MPLYLNPDALVWCDPEPNFTFSKCIDEVRRLDTDDELWKKKLATPLLHGNHVPSWLQFEPLARKILRIWGFMPVEPSAESA